MFCHKKNIFWQYGMLFCFLAGFGSCTDAERIASSYSGYVEGDYRFISASGSGRLIAMPWQVGDEICAGALVLKIEDELQALAVEQAQARLNAARSQLADLRRGKRIQVLTGLQARREGLLVTFNQARLDAERNEKLAAKNSLAQADAQHSRTKVRELQKQIEVIDAEIALARLPAREDQIAAGQSRVEAARVALAEARAVQARRVVYSQFGGRISAVYAHAGEWVQSGQAVIKVLPKRARKVVFYVPEPEVSRWKIEDKVMVSADGLPPQMAIIREIDDQACFTPPVIYSETTRAKLVFRMVAYFEDEGLPVGLPVSVRDV